MPATAKKPAGSKLKVLGKVVHFYDHLGVAIVELATKVKVGDIVCFKRDDQELIQGIESMQIDHESVNAAKKGQVIGMKVDEPVKEGALMIAA